MKQREWAEDGWLWEHRQIRPAAKYTIVCGTAENKIPARLLVAATAADDTRFELVDTLDEAFRQVAKWEAAA